MKQVGLLFPLLLVVCMSIPAPQAHYDAEDYKMAVLDAKDLDYHQSTPDVLVNGAYAQDDTLAELTKGPKVNGGFAINVLPKHKDSHVANADCAGGYYVDGRCVRSFPKVARVATVEDNMGSPEQGDAAYETDIHKFVQKHFNEAVMKDYDEGSYHAGLPGYEVVDNRMNENGNEDPNEATQYLFPVGSHLMQDGDQEYDVKFNYADMNKNEHQEYQHQDHTPEDDAAHTHEDSYNHTEHHDDQSTYTPPIPPAEHHTPTDDSYEHVPTVDVSQEVDDLEYEIPKVAVDEEQGLPPTPTPTPTPNLEELEKKQEADKARLDQINTCLAFLEAQDITCTGTETEKLAMSYHADEPKQMAPKPETEEGSYGVALLEEDVNYSELRESYQNMISFCTREAMNTFDKKRAEKGSETAQLLSKYADAMTCAAGENFPQCVSIEATKVLVVGPDSQGRWRCF